MQKYVEWMIIADRILEYLSENETTSEMAKVDIMRFSRFYLHLRCDVLEEYGLIRYLGNGVHIITE